MRARAAQDVEDFEAPPVEALAAYAAAQRVLVALGRPGSVSLKMDYAPGHVRVWSVWIGNMRYGRPFMRTDGRACRGRNAL